MTTVLTLYFPSVLGLLWRDNPAISIVWSLIGSLFIAAIAQVHSLRSLGVDLPLRYRLLRPTFIYHFYFVLANVVGGACYALNAAGYHLMQREAVPMVADLAPIATAQSLMLLGHASVTV